MNKTAAKYGKQLVRSNRKLDLVRLGLVKVSPLCQRELRKEWVDEILSRFDIDKLGNPEVSHRDGHFYIMDGQHRIEAVKAFLGKGWEEQHIECFVAEGLSEEEEAEVFLSLNDRRAVSVFERFKVAVRAGRPVETEIAAIVKSEHLAISKQLSTSGAVACVGTLIRVYQRNGSDALRRALVLARDSFGDSGMDACVIDGFGLVCHRYNGMLNEATAIQSLSKAHGGVNGLLGLAEQMRKQTGNQKSHCVAAATVTIVNRDRKGANKLQPWWKN